MSKKKRIFFTSSNGEDNDSVGFVTSPSQKIINKADLIYKTRYSEAIRQGALTHSEATKFITERNIWTEDDTKELISLYHEIDKLGEQLKEIDDMQDGAITVLNIERLRFDILRLNQKKNSVLDNTAESYAEEHRLQFFTLSCTFLDGGSKAWKDEDDFLDRADTDFARDAIRYTLNIMTNAGQDFRKDWPEYQWRMKMGLIDEDLKPINKDEEEEPAIVEGDKAENTE